MCRRNAHSHLRQRNAGGEYVPYWSLCDVDSDAEKITKANSLSANPRVNSYISAQGNPKPLIKNRRTRLPRFWWIRIINHSAAGTDRRAKFLSEIVNDMTFVYV